ncbi:hypothetical protein [Nonomuraea cavernae]|uniref:hypothetical protein n=1 Tax=Nonomuraea cavernae TaxID=2045107 RepID=UPI00166B9283|nr:hypothetical protein [Nonomuraea cavernae]MCA2185638.1 hypothetical protein [Nonomuraea cavernae]
MFTYRSPGAMVLVAAATLVTTTATTSSAQAHEAPATAADRVLRVYNNNIENLVRNNADGTCTRISGPDHLTSMLVDDNGRTGTSGVQAPDLLIVQQVRGTGQTTAYADQLSAKFGYPAGTYKAVVAWDDPEPWGSSHKCSQQALGDLKKKQTNAIVYNTRTLSLASGDVSKYWSAGWLKPGTPYNGGAGCTLYKPPNNDSGTTNAHKWKRTSAIAARFTIKETGTTVFAATMHLPEQNGANACAGAGTTGIANSGIHVGADATSLMNASTIRVIGIDANRTNIASSTLGGFGMTGYGAKATSGSRKIDYLFVKGAVQPSSVDHTVSGTKSNHLALYGFITY